MPTTYTLVDTGEKIMPPKNRITWHPSRHWRRFPVRISELATDEDDYHSSPFAFGYLYDVSNNMTEVIIHCVSENNPREILFYKEELYNSLKSYYYTYTFTQPNHPRRIEDFIEIQLDDGEWISIKTYLRFVVGDTLRYIAPAEERRHTPRENAEPVPFPGGGAVPEDFFIPPPREIRMGANGVVARSISSNPLDYEEDPTPN